MRLYVGLRGPLQEPLAGDQASNGPQSAIRINTQLYFDFLRCTYIVPKEDGVNK